MKNQPGEKINASEKSNLNLENPKQWFKLKDALCIV